MIVFGTRPEAIKMAPLVKALQAADDFNAVVCVTAQHRQMLDQVLCLFDIHPQYDLDIMHQGQDLYDVTTRILLRMRDILSEEKPDIVLVHGDTTTSTTAALAAFYQHITVGHVEAGLRTHNIYSPWPEELNRQLTARIASLHFAPTALCRENLINEGIPDNHIFITGNTIIDTLHYIIHKANIKPSTNSRRLVLVTGHRRENFGDGITHICQALKTLADKYSDADFIYPVHPNPNVKSVIAKVFDTTEDVFCYNGNLRFIKPLEYIDFVGLLCKSTIVLTDSGGIQEEAPGLGKPVLVMRNTTERPEALEAGTVKLVGTNYNKIVKEVSTLLDDKEAYNRMSHAVNPYGDGKTSERIVEILRKKLK